MLNKQIELTENQLNGILKIPQNTILKVFMSKVKEGNGIIKVVVGNKFYNKKIKTLNNESELFRIAKHLRSYYLQNDTDIEMENDIDIIENYPLIQDLLCVKINKGSKTWYEKTIIDKDGIKRKNGELVTVKYYDQIIESKIEDEKQVKNFREEYITEITYRRIIVSSSHARQSKVIYVNEKIYDDVMNILLCGMPKNMEVEKYAKFNAHFGLASTDGIPLKAVPKFVVVSDVEMPIYEHFDIVEEYGENKYRVNKNKKKVIKNKVSDGGGIICRDYLEKIAKEDLHLDYIPSSILIRMIPGIKGNLYSFPLKEYVKEKEVDTIIDRWGDAHSFAEENIVAILPESMVKFANKYKNYAEWEKAFAEEIKGYKRTFNVCDVAEDYNKISNFVNLSYQSLQTLDLNLQDIESLCKYTVDSIKKCSLDCDSFIRFRGIVKNQNSVPEYYKALAENKSLWYDSWIQKKVQQDLEGMKKDAYLGGISVRGNYQVLAYDLTLLAAKAFGIKDYKGCLNPGEVYSKYWFDKGKAGRSILICRYPHVSHEWRKLKVANIDNMDKNPDIKYLRYMETVICCSGKDSLYQRLGGADVDNDIIQCVDNSIIRSAVDGAKEWKNTVIYENTIPEVIPDENNRKKPKVKKFTIDNISKLIETDAKAMTANIGHYVNKVTILHSLPQTDKIRNYIRQMLIISSKCIDFAKTGIPPKLTDEIRELLKEHPELPMFMKYRYPQKLIDQEKTNYNLRKADPKAELKYKFNKYDCTMDKLCAYLEKNIADIKVTLPKKIPIDYSEFYKKRPDQYHSVYYRDVFTLMHELQEDANKMAEDYVSEDLDNKDIKIENASKYKLFYDYCKSKLLSICPDEDKLIDCMVFIQYEDKKTKYKDAGILWNCFGSRLRERISNKAMIKTDEGNSGDQEEKKEINKERAIKLRKKLNMDGIELKIRIGSGKNVDIINISDKEITLTKAERDYLKKNAVGNDQKRLLTTIWAISKLCKANDSNLKIYTGGKDVGEIKRKNIIDIAGINSYRMFNKLTDTFRDNSVINISINPNLSSTIPYHIIDVPISEGGDPVVTVKNLGEIKKIFQKIC